ncbi:hypothetical protein K505DRAFT_103653 [Melanomma pulvis-pyrius CBS 109.77]|uniref:Uncharacterized protein n=1 Tax=Melanomma pulvis-pyrius CBS 109.77 TaxID=1314802 RepID=A0A6A6WYE6_9PLEO|nr:hypothetical protein K505DRAFT_103653 [Melanomma pulvis-pyrius CBS 109.77]
MGAFQDAACATFLLRASTPKLGKTTDTAHARSPAIERTVLLSSSHCAQDPRRRPSKDSPGQGRAGQAGQGVRWLLRHRADLLAPPRRAASRPPASIPAATRYTRNIAAYAAIHDRRTSIAPRLPCMPPRTTLPTLCRCTSLAVSHLVANLALAARSDLALHGDTDRRPKV